MRSRTRWPAATSIAAALIAIALPLTACGQVSSTAPEPDPPATVEKIGDTGLNRLTLTAKAVQRLDIRTAAVAVEGAVTAVPYAALLYQPDGATFVYTNPDPRTYVREAVSVAEIAGDRVLLTAGPAAGAAVVTRGAAELWGTEFKIGKY